MIAIRAVMRIGWEIPNPITSLNPDNATRFPFAVVVPSAATTTYDVTFTVQNDGSTPIEGATVLFGGQEKVTDVSGNAVFKVLGNTTYTYAVTMEGKQPAVGKVDVESSAKPITVKLLGE